MKKKFNFFKKQIISNITLRLCSTVANHSFHLADKIKNQKWWIIVLHVSK